MSGRALGSEDRAGLELVRSIQNVSRETSERLLFYIKLLRQWQARINLVAPSTLSDLWGRHVADCAQVYALKTKAKTWIDIGSGAGFPGLVTAILLAEDGRGRVELIESNGKKCAFLRTVVRETGLTESGVEVFVHQGRIEDILPTLEPPDVISARALASLDDLLRLTEPYLANDCFGIFQKGRDHRTEIDEARKGWDFDLEITGSRFGEASVLLTVQNVARKTGSNA